MAGARLRLEDLPEALRSTDVAFVDDIIPVNFKPHPYTVGAEHIEEAQKYGGILGEEVCRTVPCAQRRCNLSYEEHTSDLVAFVKLRKNCQTEELRQFLVAIADFAKENGKHLDGFAFVETPEGYKVNS